MLQHTRNASFRTLLGFSLNDLKGSAKRKWNIQVKQLVAPYPPWFCCRYWQCNRQDNCVMDRPRKLVKLKGPNSHILCLPAQRYILYTVDYQILCSPSCFQTLFVIRSLSLSRAVTASLLWHSYFYLTLQSAVFFSFLQQLSDELPSQFCKLPFTLPS